ncbi:MAG: response regulator transcription factor [Bacillota bacterium]
MERTPIGERIAERGDSMAQIMVIDDESSICLLLHEYFSLFGHETIAINDGWEALERIRSMPVPDIFLLDCMLPGISGWDICRQLKSDPRTGQAPVIMVSALTRESDIENGTRAGADDYVTKPFDLDLLLAKIEKLIGGRVAKAQ